MRTLRPGMLVSLKTTIAGGVSYQRTDLTSQDLIDGAHRATWETTKTVDDPAEHERAVKARGKARSLVTAVCAQSEFGLLCPTARAAELEEAIRQARIVATDFNESARTCHVDIYTITGQIASTDQEAVRAISAEMSALMAQMEQGIKAADPAAIREAAAKARSIGQMLDAPTQEKVSKAIEQAREAARTIVRRVEKDGEKAADVVAELRSNDVQAARFAFLDFDDSEPAPQGEAPKAKRLDLESDTIGDAEPTRVCANPFYTAPRMEL